MTLTVRDRGDAPGSRRKTTLGPAKSIHSTFPERRQSRGVRARPAQGFVSGAEPTRLAELADQAEVTELVGRKGAHLILSVQASTILRHRTDAFDLAFVSTMHSSEHDGSSCRL
jgi:hypothetical protein